MNFYKNIVLICIAICSFSFVNAQTSGRYRPTKYDSVKKVIPEQVYGRLNRNDNSNESTSVNQDSIDNANEAIQLLQQKLDAQKKMSEERRLEELKRKQDNSSLEEQKRIEQENNEKEAKKRKYDLQKEMKALKEQQKVLEEQKRNADSKPKYNPNQAFWTLENCIKYAKENNLQIANVELNERMAKLIKQQTLNSRLPSLNGDANLGESYGRSIDPTSNQFVTKGFLYNTLGVSSQALLFGWFQKQHQTDQNDLDLKAAMYATNQLREDISLNVATGFLRVLLAREQIKINETQLKLDNEQYQQTIQFVNAGKLPELNAAQMLAQLSSDSATLVSSVSNEQIAMLELRALMNFSFDQDFDIVAPSNLELNEIASLYALPEPEMIYNTAIENQNQTKYNQLKLLSAKKSLDIAKAMQYPQLSVFANLGTNFSSNVKNITGQTYIGETPLGNINVAGTSYPVTAPNYQYQTQTRPLFTQYGNNIRANAGIALSIPIFNGYTAQTNIQKAKIGLVSQQIATDNDKQKLKQSIYKAYQEAKAASQKYAAAKRSQEASQRALNFAVKRFEVGMISTYEYTSSLSSLYNANASVLSSKYDMIFKLKVLDYYMGNSIKL